MSAGPRPMEPHPELRAAIARAPWKATTYVAPHEYVMEHWSPECLELVAAVCALIRGHGYDRAFRGASFPTVHLGAHYYWTMRLDYPEIVDGKRPGGPICLNRATLPVAT